jgi:hypothetical protein
VAYDDKSRDPVLNAQIVLISKIIPGLLLAVALLGAASCAHAASAVSAPIEDSMTAFFRS